MPFTPAWFPFGFHLDGIHLRTKSYCENSLCFDFSISPRLSAGKMEPDSNENLGSCQKSPPRPLPWIWYPRIRDARRKIHFLQLLCFHQGKALQLNSYFPVLFMGNLEKIFFLFRFFFSPKNLTKGHFCFQMHQHFFCYY